MSWQAFEAELARWREAGRSVEFWWRDDDAAEPCTELDRLLALSRSAAVPLALAVVPLAASAAIFDGMDATVLQHGTDHRNRAAPGEKKNEFPAAEPDVAALERLRSAAQRLKALAGDRFLPVLAPPWNRFRRSLLEGLPEIGLRGVSVFGARASARPARGVAEANTHVDIVDWHGTRGFAGEDAALRGALAHLVARRVGECDAGEPTGWLTHHLVHDRAAWDFLERLFDRTRRLGVRWAEPRDIFLSRR